MRSFGFPAAVLPTRVRSWAACTPGSGKRPIPTVRGRCSSRCRDPCREARRTDPGLRPGRLCAVGSRRAGCLTRRPLRSGASPTPRSPLGSRPYRPSRTPTRTTSASACPSRTPAGVSSTCSPASRVSSARDCRSSPPRMSEASRGNSRARGRSGSSRGPSRARAGAGRCSATGSAGPRSSSCCRRWGSCGRS